jgi:transcriptional regulator with XRE-family HTH domain
MSARRLSRVVGELIRTTRIAGGITQRVLGERAGIVGKYVSEIERGTRDVPLSTLLAIAERGLGRRLAIRFEGVDEAAEGVSLAAGVEQVALAISELPEATRVKVLQVVRAILELAR